MGSWWRKERNMVVLLLFVVVRMEKEMEGRMVEELVEMVVELEGGMVENDRPKEGAWLRFAAIGSVACWKRRKGKMKEREEEKGGYIYKGIV